MCAVSSKADIFRTGGILFLQPSNNCQNYIHICVYASEKIGVHHFSNFIGEKKIYIYISEFMLILLLKYMGLDFGHPGNNNKVDQKINIKRVFFIPIRLCGPQECE